jgi:NAD(P)-dependent dehydrogenase (short-subunit alcohol dehydrogenase family)
VREDAAGPVVLVTGATGGIGSELCRRLAASGARLMLVARGEDRLRDLAAETGGEMIAADATRFDEMEHAADAAVERWGTLDGAVNCVGSILLRPAHLTREEDFQETIALNLTSAFAVLRAAVMRMNGKGGAVVLVSSAAARLGLSNHEAIAAAKAGVEALARSAAATYANRGIRVNAVAPGLVRTGLAAKITANPASERASRSMHALDRLGEPADVAAAIAWLLGPDAGWVTGQVYGVDGGLSTVRSR